MALIQNTENLIKVAKGNPEITSLQFNSLNEITTYAKTNMGYIEGTSAEVIAELTDVTSEVGGTQTGSTVYQIVEGTSESGATVYTFEAVGAGVGVSFGSVVGAVLAGIGIGLVANNTHPEFWNTIAEHVFGTTYPPIGAIDYFFPSIWQESDGKIYLPYETIRDIYDGYNATGSKAFPSPVYQIPSIKDIGGKPYIRIENAPDKVNPKLLIAEAKKLCNNSDYVRQNPTQYFTATIDYKDPLIEEVFTMADNHFIETYGFAPNGYNVQATYVYASGRCDISVVAYFIPIKTDVKVDIHSDNDVIEVIDTNARAGKTFIYRGYENRTTHIMENTSIGSFATRPNLGIYIPPNSTKNQGNINTYSAPEFSEPDDWVHPITDTANEYDPTQDFEQNFPAWINHIKNVTTRIINPNGELETETYIPLTPIKEDPLSDPDRYPDDYPYDIPVDYPDQDPDRYPRTGHDPDPIQEPWTNPWSPPSPSMPIAPYVPITPPDTGRPTQPELPPSDPTPTEPTGDTPTIPLIPPLGGEANALFTVYNPTLSQLNSLGGYLWSSNILEQIMRIFTNNPMDAIISLHILYATPSVGSSRHIKLGYLDSGVSALEVTKQYINVPCGTIEVNELYGDARDYSPYTSIHIFLPFIGIRPLKTEDIIGSKVTVDYKVDVYTGTVLCNILISKSNTNQILYTYEGNCSVTLPLTGADRSRMISGIASIGMAIATKNPSIAGASAVSGAFKSDVDRSGGFSGNAGAMGGKKPYLIINRSIVSDAINYNNFYGFPAYRTVTLNECSGYTRIRSVHVDNIPNATQIEKDTIEELLKNGVIIQ